MSDNGGTGGTSLEGGAGTNQAGQEPDGNQNGANSTGGNANQENQGPKGTGQELSIEQILEGIQDPAQKAYLEKLAKDTKAARSEAGDYRSRYQSEKQAREELERQNETDAERVEREQKERNDRLTALEQENRNLRVHAALEATAGSAGAHNPVRVRELLDAKVELDQDGKPANLQEILADLKRTDPYLFKRATNDANEGGGTSGAPSGSSMNNFIRGGRR